VVVNFRLHGSELAAIGDVLQFVRQTSQELPVGGLALRLGRLLQLSDNLAQDLFELVGISRLQLLEVTEEQPKAGNGGRAFVSVDGLRNAGWTFGARRADQCGCRARRIETPYRLYVAHVQSPLTSSTPKMLSIKMGRCGKYCRN